MKPLLRIISLLLLNFALTLSILASVSIADHSEENLQAFQAYNSGHYEKAFKLWLNEAEKGDMLAQGMVGSMYERGKGTSRNFEEAAKWYQLAAGQGYLNSQFNLGSLYLKGQGVPQSDEKAYAWWRVAAAKGNEIAQREVRALQKTMTPVQIERAQNLARDIWVKIGWEKIQMPESFPDN